MKKAQFFYSSLSIPRQFFVLKAKFHGNNIALERGQQGNGPKIDFLDELCAADDFLTLLGRADFKTAAKLYI